MDRSPSKVAEYEAVGSSPFADLDGLFTDGCRTVDFFGTYLDNDSGQAEVDYFGPRMAADVRLRRYPHRLEHD